ncbi:hypothetical protein ABZ336_44630, partial [Streptomyces griseorubiginosus]
MDAPQAADGAQGTGWGVSARSGRRPEPGPSIDGPSRRTEDGEAALWAVAGLGIVGGKALMKRVPLKLITKVAAL